MLSLCKFGTPRSLCFVRLRVRNSTKKYIAIIRHVSNHYRYLGVIRVHIPGDPIRCSAINWNDTRGRSINLCYSLTKNNGIMWLESLGISKPEILTYLAIRYIFTSGPFIYLFFFVS